VFDDLGVVMAKITHEQFLEATNEDNKGFVQEIHDYLLENGCKAAFEEKANGYLASYKYGKPPRAFLNFLIKSHDTKARIYGENAGGYAEFLNSLPCEMVEQIEAASDCKPCSEKCSGGYRFQNLRKCRYSCFEFLMTDASRPYIKGFIEQELAQRKV